MWNGPSTVAGVGAVGEAVVELHDEHAQPEHVGREDELLALLVGRLSRRGQPLDRGDPLRLGELDRAREVVQVAHQRGQQLGGARVARGRPSARRRGR